MEKEKKNNLFDKEIDPSISRKRKILDISATQKEDFILPGIVEVSESGICNRKCSFCPRSDKNYPDIKEFVKDELIEKLTSQLGKLNYKGIFLFSGFVEPLLDKNIFNLLQIVRKNTPFSPLVTHEKLLAKFFTIFKAFLIDLVLVKDSNPCIEKATWEASFTDLSQTGVSASKTPGFLFFFASFKINILAFFNLPSVK